MTTSYLGDQEQSDRLSAAMTEIDEEWLSGEVYDLPEDEQAPVGPVSTGEPQVCPTCQNAGCYCGRCRSKGYLGPEGEPLPWGWERTEVSDGETAE